MRHRPLTLRLLRSTALAVALVAVVAPSRASAQAPAVHAVLFYSPTCPHCHEVINTHLPPLRERYGERFVIIGVDVTTPGGGALYDAAVDYYGLAPDRLGVPLLVVGEVALLGSLEIPQQLPGLIEKGLAEGGTPWPALPALRDALSAQGLIPAATEPDLPVDTGTTPPRDAAPEPEQTPGAAPEPEPTPRITTSLSPGDVPRVTPIQRFLQDPVANGIAVAALALLLGALALGVLGARAGGPGVPAAPGWAFPVFTAVGLCIALYLSMVEVTGAQAVCGPVGDCNTVQQSAYAHLFGVVPVGVLGALGYVAMLVAWGVAVAGPQGRRGSARVVLWAFAMVGSAFSAYLTFLEPFVIGATCAWCVSSALIMGGLLLAATGELRRGA